MAPWFDLVGCGLSATCFLLVVSTRNAYAPRIFLEGLHRRLGRLRLHPVAIGMSVWRARGGVCRDLCWRWANADEVKASGLSDGWRDARRATGVSASTDRSVLASLPRREAARGRPRGSLAPDLAGKLHRPRHQGRELEPHRRPRARFGRDTVRSDQHASSAYNPLLGPPRRWSPRRQNVADVLVDPEGSLERTIIGKTSVRYWSVRSFMSSMPRPTRRFGASRRFCPIPGVRSRRRWSR